MKPSLAVRDLTKQFGKFTAVDRVSFELAEGEILGFLGPNGAGKTTTIQMLLGVLTPTSGDILYFGKSLSTHRSEVVEHVGFSSTYTNLPWDLTVLECLRYSALLYDIPDRRKRLAEIVELFDLAELQRRQIKELSEGEKTRVNLAKAFLPFPKVLLLDEPTASLDPDVATYVRDLLKRRRDEMKLSILWTSHNMNEVEEVCDRVIFLNEAKVIANDTPEKLARSMRTSRVKLVSVDHGDALLDVCRQRTFVARTDAKLTTIEVPHDQIGSLLHDLAVANVRYADITIDQPSLEEFFVSYAQRGSAS
jgi:ABC-2 type transport system ATP-binding protein